MNSRKITYAEAINEALIISMKNNKNLLCYGLGVDDPKAVFGTTKNLKKIFGNNRVFDMPSSENAMTGISVGAALGGYPSVVVHQRLDFFLLAMDQLVNAAAKWHYMFGGQNSISITIRLIVGRGWGQGPTHSQSLQAWFAHIPGLKVIMPSTPYDVKGLLISSILDKNPVVFIEHRWLHNQEGFVPKEKYSIPLSKSKIIQKGKDITIISMSYMTIEAIRASKILSKYSISCEVLDLRAVSPIDYQSIFKSVKKTGRVLVLDTGNANGSIAGEIIARISINIFKFLKSSPVRIALPDFPVPTSYGLTKKFYPNAENIIKNIFKIFDKKVLDIDFNDKDFHDTPGDWFKGPF